MHDLEKMTATYLRWAPISLAIREVTRIHAIHLLDERYGLLKARSILDVGCGDGRWWKLILPAALERVHGVDISSSEVELAKKLIHAQCLDVTTEAFRNAYPAEKFDLIIGNCSIEHIYHIDKALDNIFSRLSRGGHFILFVPTPFWAFKGRSMEALNRISPRLAMAFSGLMNGFFQHWHLYHFRIWQNLLESFGYEVKATHGLGNQRSEFAFRLFLIPAFFSFLIKKLTGKYFAYFVGPFIPRPILRRLSSWLNSMLDNELQPPDGNDIFEYILICRKP